MGPGDAAPTTRAIAVPVPSTPTPPAASCRKGEDPQPTTMRHWLCKCALEMQKQPKGPKGKGMAEQKEPKGEQQKQKTNKMK